MISNQRFDHLEAMIKEAEEAGATVVGGRRLDHAYLSGGVFFDGTVVGDATPDLQITQTECKSLYGSVAARLLIVVDTPSSIRSCGSSDAI